MKSSLTLLHKLFTYNIKVIFASKFIYFVLAGFLFFAFIITLSIFENPNFNEAAIYGFLIFPGILLIFYPMAYGIQNDDDSKMLETIFGIPNYRYKVWLVRFFLTIFVAALILFVMAILANLSLYRFDILPMVGQVMFPITFLGAIGFMLSTWVRSGNGSAITLVIIGFFFLIFIEALEYTQWNVFLNPYEDPRDMSEFIWLNVIFKNRIYLMVGSGLCLLFGMFNLQFREKFI